MRARPQPLTLLVLATSGVVAGLAGWESALVTLACIAATGLLAPRRLGIRAVALAGGAFTVLIVLPFAPRAVANVSIRGVAVSLALVCPASAMSWSAAIAEIQRFGLPRAAVAFLALLARHIELLLEDARAVVAVLKVRGAFDHRANLTRGVVVLLSRLMALAWLRADRLADSMAVRGFDGRLPPNSPWRPQVGEARPYVLALVMMASATWELAR
jgi:energy-coupling factor transporter transmembrane protein EcfT